MTKRLLGSLLALSTIVMLGAGCNPLNSGGPDDLAADGKGDNGGVEICIRTDNDASGTVRFFAANTTDERKNDEQWFTNTPVAEKDAGKEICGKTTFAAEEGDVIKLNGDWANGSRWLAENRTPDASGSDNLSEIWIDDQYYAVGQECEYRSNGLKGFDVFCTIR